MKGETLRLLQLFNFSESGVQYVLGLVTIAIYVILVIIGNGIQFAGFSAFFDSLDIGSLLISLLGLGAIGSLSSWYIINLMYLREPWVIPVLDIEFPIELIYAWRVVTLGSLLVFIVWAGNNVRNRHLGLTGPTEIMWEKRNPVKIEAEHLGHPDVTDTCLSSWDDLPPRLQLYHDNTVDRRDSVQGRLEVCENDEDVDVVVDEEVVETIDTIIDAIKKLKPTVKDINDLEGPSPHANKYKFDFILTQLQVGLENLSDNLDIFSDGLTDTQKDYGLQDGSTVADKLDIIRRSIDILLTNVGDNLSETNWDARTTDISMGESDSAYLEMKEAADAIKIKLEEFAQPVPTIDKYVEQKVSYISDGVIASGKIYRVNMNVNLDITGNYYKQVFVEQKNGTTWEEVKKTYAYTVELDKDTPKTWKMIEIDDDNDDGITVGSEDGVVTIYNNLSDGTVLKIRLDDKMHLPTTNDAGNEVDVDGTIAFKLIPSKAATKPLKLTIKAIEAENFAQPYQDVIDFESV